MELQPSLPQLSQEPKAANAEWGRNSGMHKCTAWRSLEIPHKTRHHHVRVCGRHTGVLTIDGVRAVRKTQSGTHTWDTTQKASLMVQWDGKVQEHILLGSEEAASITGSTSCQFCKPEGVISAPWGLADSSVKWRWDCHLFPKRAVKIKQRMPSAYRTIWHMANYCYLLVLQRRHQWSLPCPSAHRVMERRKGDLNLHPKILA